MLYSLHYVYCDTVYCTISYFCLKCLCCWHRCCCLHRCCLQYPELHRSTSPVASSVTMTSLLPGNLPVRLRATANELNATNLNTGKPTGTTRWGRREMHAGKKYLTSVTHASPSQVRSTFPSASAVICANQLKRLACSLTEPLAFEISLFNKQITMWTFIVEIKRLTIKMKQCWNTLLVSGLKFDTRFVVVRVRAKNKAAAGEFSEPVAVETRGDHKNQRGDVSFVSST